MYSPIALLADQDFRSTLLGSGSLPVQKAGSRAQARRYRGPVKRANLLSEEAAQAVRARILERSRSPESDFVKLQLSLKAGMRASEIAHISIDAMRDVNGRISDHIEIYASKTRNSRELPMHPEIREALAQLLLKHPDATHVAFSIGRRGNLRRQSASCVANFFSRLYRSTGLKGCSSHSGRRTFATKFVRLLSRHDASLKDLQIALGHTSLSSTECYLEPSDRMAQIIRDL